MADELHRHGCKRNGAERGATRPRREQRGAPPSQRGKRPAPPRPARTALPDAAGAQHHQLVLAGLPRAARPGPGVHLLNADRTAAASEGEESSVSPTALSAARPLRFSLTSGRSVTRFTPPQPRGPAPSSGGDPKMAAGPRQRKTAPM